MYIQWFAKIFEHFQPSEQNNFYKIGLNHLNLFERFFELEGLVDEMVKIFEENAVDR